MTSNCITVSSLKGNTLGILEHLNLEQFKYCRIGKEDPSQLWSDSKTILLGSSTYYKSGTANPYFPEQFNKYKGALMDLHGKNIVLFGSGRREYPLYCGTLDYLKFLLEKENNILTIYKFEGYPRERQKIEFKKLMEELLNV